MKWGGGENVTGYKFGISYTCDALLNKSAFIATCRVFALQPGFASGLGTYMRFLRVRDK